VDLTGFYATVSGVGFTLLGLWWVVVDKHPEWFEDKQTARMAYVVSLQFILPATSSLLSLVATDAPGIWRAVFALLGLVGVAGSLLVAQTLAGTQPGASIVALLLSLPVYLGIVLVALFPTIGSGVDLTGLQLEAFLIALVLVLGLNAVWFFTHHALPRTVEPPSVPGRSD
jgi:hypothetical protein